MLLGQKSRCLLRHPLHVTPSRIIHGLSRRIILPVFSSRNLSTRRRTRKFLPQYGTISTSNQSPRFRCHSLRVHMISSFERTWTNSPACRFSTSVGVFFFASPRIYG